MSFSDDDVPVTDTSPIKAATITTEAAPSVDHRESAPLDSTDASTDNGFATTWTIPCSTSPVVLDFFGSPTKDTLSSPLSAPEPISPLGEWIENNISGGQFRRELQPLITDLTNLGYKHKEQLMAFQDRHWDDLGSQLSVEAKAWCAMLEQAVRRNEH